MSWPTQPIENLPAWAHFNGVSFSNAKVASTEDKGYGVVTSEDLKDDTSDAPALITVPHDLVLNAAAVDEHAKEDKDFRQLLDAVGHGVTEPPPA